jgi:hypothetical protein
MKTDNQRKTKNTRIIDFLFLFFILSLVPMKFVGIGISSLKYRFFFFLTIILAYIMF